MERQGFGVIFELPMLSIQYLMPLLAAQTAVNVVWLRSAPRPFPDLYEFFPSIFYYADPHHTWNCPSNALPWDSLCPSERLSIIPTILERGYADCKCLCAWRAAELQVKYGDDGARAVAVPARHDPDYLHVVVVRGDGMAEDASRRMGSDAFFEAKQADRLDEYFRWRVGNARR